MRFTLFILLAEGQFKTQRVSESFQVLCSLLLPRQKRMDKTQRKQFSA